MPRVSRRRVDNKIWKMMSRYLIYSIEHAKTETEIQSVLQGLCTQNEMITISKRLMIQIMLIQGCSVDYICQNVKVSRSTIHKQKEILVTRPEYKQHIKKLIPSKIWKNISQNQALKWLVEFGDYMDTLGQGRRHRSKLYR